MWAGSRIRFLRDISLGAPLTRTSSVAAVSPKSGRSGNMLFVTVRHEIRDESGDPAIVDEHDIVYREASPLGASCPDRIEFKSTSIIGNGVAATLACFSSLTA